jgi:hypothetical protein
MIMWGIAEQNQAQRCLRLAQMNEYKYFHCREDRHGIKYKSKESVKSYERGVPLRTREFNGYSPKNVNNDLKKRPVKRGTEM